MILFNRRQKVERAHSPACLLSGQKVKGILKSPLQPTPKASKSLGARFQHRTRRSLNDSLQLAQSHAQKVADLKLKGYL